MRKIVRAAGALLLAYMLQATVLPYFRIGGMLLDLISITLFTLGYVQGLYAAIVAGMACALIMEVLSGDLSALISVFCVAAGVLGALAAPRVDQVSVPGRRGLERQIKRFAPMVLIAAFVMVKELLYVGYFYLTGINLTFMHFYRPLVAGLYAGACALAVVPFLTGFLKRDPQDTMLARRRRRRAEKKKPKPVEPETAEGFWDETPDIPLEGGTVDE